MNPEQRDRILAAVNQLCIDINGIGMIESMSEAHRIFARLADIAGQIKTREQVITLFDSFEDLSWQDEKLTISACKYGRPLFRIAVMAIAAQVKDEFPRPPVGRNRLFKPDEEIDVCQRIGKFVVQKVELKDAFLRVSQQFGVSPRTIRRVWEDRDEIAAETRDPDFNTTLKAVKGLLSDENP
jgi:hypothetical protein